MTALTPNSLRPTVESQKADASRNTRALTSAGWYWLLTVSSGPERMAPTEDLLSNLTRPSLVSLNSICNSNVPQHGRSPWHTEQPPVPSAYYAIGHGYSTAPKAREAQSCSGTLSRADVFVLPSQAADWKWSTAHCYIDSVVDSALPRLNRPPTELFTAGGVQTEHHAK